MVKDKFQCSVYAYGFVEDWSVCKRATKLYEKEWGEVNFLEK